MLIVDRVKVSAEAYWVVSGCKMWGGMEGTISPEDNPIEAWVELKNKLEEAMNNSDSMKGTIIQQIAAQHPKTKEDQMAKIISEIESCNDVGSLDGYKYYTQTYPEIKQAYDNMFIQLQKKIKP